MNSIYTKLCSDNIVLKIEGKKKEKKKWWCIIKGEMKEGRVFERVAKSNDRTNKYDNKHTRGKVFNWNDFTEATHSYRATLIFGHFN